MPSLASSGGNVPLASLALNILSLGLPIVILQVYDRILPNAAISTLYVLILGLCGVLLADAFFRTARAYITGWNAARLEHSAGCRAVDRMLASDICEFEKDAPGVHLDRFYAIDELREYHAGQARQVMVDLPFVGVFLVLIWVIGGPLVLIPLGLLAALGATGGLLAHALKRVIRKRVELDDRRHSFIIEVLSRIQTVKLLAMEPLLQRRYERLQESAAVGTYKTTFLSNLTQGVGALFSSLVMISVAGVGATHVIADQLSIGSLAACTLLSGRSVQPLLRGLGIWAQVQNVAVAKERVAELFALAPESLGLEESFDELAGAITLRDVTFGYDGDAAALLENINLTVEPGEVIGISGESGGGKTTLLMLMMGLLKPNSGRVEYDGVDLVERDPYSLRRQVAYLPQTPAIFRGSILENLTMFQDGESIDEALAAAQIIGLHEKVHRLPEGYGTEIGDGASIQLPSGTRQLIAIARALAGRQRVILFDEANSLLDSETDVLVKNALAALKRNATIVLVSHRPSLLALSDRIYDLKGGQLDLRENAVAAGQAATGAPRESLRQTQQTAGVLENWRSAS